MTSSWLKSVFQEARRMVQDGQPILVDHHEDDDGAVTKLMITDNDQRVQITWGRGSKKHWR